MDKIKICYVLPNIPNPRMNKRITVAKEIGCPYVICVRRKSQDLFEILHNDIQNIVYDIDLPPAKYIFRRLKQSSKFHRLAIRDIEKIDPEIIHVGGFDCVRIACKYKRKHPDVKIVYEVSDLREDFISVIKNPVRRLLSEIIRTVEKKDLKKITKMVVTSEKFYVDYYSKFIEKERVNYIPNYPDLSCFKNYRKKQTGVFTVGFIGGIRYLNQLKMLVDVADILKINVIFAGAGGTNSNLDVIMEYAKDKDNIKFTGKYDYKNEIGKLYSMVDCVFAVYDADNPNVRIALPNKLYEAVVCQLPIIVAEGTYLGEIVTGLGIGYTVNHKQIDSLICAINKLQVEENRKVINDNLYKAKEKFANYNVEDDIRKLYLNI